MNRIFSILFPALMTVGLLISAFVIVTSLQAASAPVNTRAQTPSASSANSNDLVAQGRALFLAKGCIVCHRIDELAAARASMMQFDFDDVPNLSNVKLDQAYLKRWLDDPQALKPATTMPNLNLSDGEIDALVAFLTAYKK